MTLHIPAKVLIHVWSYDFYDMTLSTGKQRRHMIRLVIGITWINVNHCSGTALENVKLIYSTDCYRLLHKRTERKYHSLDMASILKIGFI